MDNALEINGLRKEYEGFVLNDISFRLPRGYIMGLIGPNGAGKTTTIKLILGLIRRQAGEIRVLGLDNLRDDKAVKARTGFVLDAPAFHSFLRAGRAASVLGKFYPTWDESRFRRIAGEFGVPLDKRVSALSRGTIMKLAIAVALSHAPELIIMDEPTTGLDPVFRRELLERLSGLIQEERTSILFSTHLTSDLERIADYITFIRKGEILFSCEKDEIRENWAMVKGGLDLLTPETEVLFRGVQKSAYGFKALTDDVGRIRARWGDRVVVERVSFDDLIYLLNRENGHD